MRQPFNFGYMRKGRAAFGVGILMILATVLAPLEQAFVDIDASGKKTPEQLIQLVQIARILLAICLCLSIATSWAFYSCTRIHSRRYLRIPVLVAWCIGSLVGSFVCGILISGIGWPNWDRLAWSLIG